VLGEALELALPLHGHACHDVQALAEPRQVTVELAPVSLLRVGVAVALAGPADTLTHGAHAQSLAEAARDGSPSVPSAQPGSEFSLLSDTVCQHESYVQSLRVIF
jgi:hypothetical protein